MNYWCGVMTHEVGRRRRRSVMFSSTMVGVMLAAASAQGQRPMTPHSTEHVDMMEEDITLEKRLGDGWRKGWH